MLKGDVLNSEATLNDFDVIKTLDFIAGDAFTLVFRLRQAQRTDGLRYVPVDGSTLQATFQTSDGELVIAANCLADDRSIWMVDFSPEESEMLYGGNFTFQLTEDTVIKSGWVEGGLALIVTGNC